MGRGDLAELEGFMGAILKSLEPSQRRSLLRKVARSVRRSQRERINRQENPDGTRFAPRRKPKDPVPGTYAVKFLYPSGGSGAPRVVTMRSWVKQGPLMTGFDIEAGGLRSFEYAKVIRWLPVEPGTENAGAGRMKRSTIRQRAMFRKMRRIMQDGASDHEAWVGFAGRVAAVARIHQDGLVDRVSPHGPEIRYAARRLLGLTEKDRADLLDAVLDHVSPD